MHHFSCVPLFGVNGIKWMYHNYEAGYSPGVNETFPVPWAPCCGATYTVLEGCLALCTPGTECPPQTQLGTGAGWWWAVHWPTLEAGCCCSLWVTGEIMDKWWQISWRKGKERRNDPRYLQNLWRWREPTGKRCTLFRGWSYRYSDPGGSELKDTEPTQE